MITLDLGGLTLLKSFALIRSYVRYYGYKMSKNVGIRSNSRRKERKVRRRKEWREEVEMAKNFAEFGKIELYEPHDSAGQVTSFGEVEVADEQYVPASSPRSGFGLRKRYSNKVNDRLSMHNQNQTPSNPKRSSDTTNQSTSPPSPMRKIHSCLNLDSSGTRDKKQSPVKRVSSTASFPNESQHEIDQNCPEWQMIVRQDLGMAGDMLLATMDRLREARMQAINTTNHEFVNCTTQDSIDMDETKRTSNQAFNNEDHASSLKFLLSGIIKRNHLSVDDALINDCRSVAERGQHSLRKETRDAIDSYGEEVERCMDWVASGPVHLGTYNSSGGGNGDQSNGEDGISREQVMQRQLEELEKRYTLVKRMKQNMGHTALMLSGGGGEFCLHC